MSPRASAPARRAPLGPSELRRAVPLFAALGDATRLRIVTALCGGDTLSIAQLTADTAITRQGVAKHLRVLAAAGLVHDVKAGRERRWELAPAQLEAARRSLEIIEQQWDTALLKLKATVER